MRLLGRIDSRADSINKAVVVAAPEHHELQSYSFA